MAWTGGIRSGDDGRAVFQMLDDETGQHLCDRQGHEK
jgi:hypothetical protein